MILNEPLLSQPQQKKHAKNPKENRGPNQSCAVRILSFQGICDLAIRHLAVTIEPGRQIVKTKGTQ